PLAPVHQEQRASVHLARPDFQSLPPGVDQRRPGGDANVEGGQTGDYVLTSRSKEHSWSPSIPTHMFSPTGSSQSRRCCTTSTRTRWITQCWSRSRCSAFGAAAVEDLFGGTAARMFPMRRVWRSALQPRVQRIPKTVADEIAADDCDQYRQTGKRG